MMGTTRRRFLRGSLTAGAVLFPGSINLSDNLDNGEYSDMLAAIAGEATNGAQLYIEPGTYEVSTPTTIPDLSNVNIYTHPIGSKWNANTFPVELKWTGDAGETMLTVDAASTHVEGWSLTGIDFNGSGVADHGLAFRSDGVQNRDHRIERCGFRDFRNRPFLKFGSNPGEVYDFEFNEVSVFRPGKAALVPSQSEWYGGYVVVNDASGFSYDGADVGLETSAKVNIYSITAAPQDGRTAIHHRGQGSVIPANIEGDHSAGSVGIRAGRNVAIPWGTIQGCDVGIDFGDPNDPDVVAYSCFVGNCMIQNFQTAKLRFNGGPNKHNSTTVFDPALAMSYHSVFTESDIQKMTFFAGIKFGGVKREYMVPGLVVYDADAGRLVLGDGSKSGRYINTDGAL